MVLGANFDLCKKTFYQRREMIIKQVNFKERKKAVQIAPKDRRCSHFTKRYAVTPTAQQGSPLSHKGVELPWQNSDNKNEALRDFLPILGEKMQQRLKVM